MSTNGNLVEWQVSMKGFMLGKEEEIKSFYISVYIEMRHYSYYK